MDSSSPATKERSAIFVDLESLAIDGRRVIEIDVNAIFDRICEQAEPEVKNAYADWGRLTTLRTAFADAGFLEVQASHIARMKSALDVQMTVDVFDAVQEDLDPEAVREILKERLAVANLASKGGQIVVHENEIAFRLDFEVNLSGSLLFDRDGNFIDKKGDEPAADASPDTDFNRLDHDEIPLTDSLPDMDDDLPEETVSFSEPESAETPAPVAGDADLTTDAGDIDSADGSMDDFGIDGDLDLNENDMNLDEGDLDGEAPGQDDDLDLADENLELEDEELALSLENDDIDDDDLDLTGMDEENNLLIDDDDLDIADDLNTEDEFDRELDAQNLDDDINDILKESREFWEQKKE